MTSLAKLKQRLLTGPELRDDDDRLGPPSSLSAR